MHTPPSPGRWRRITACAMPVLAVLVATSAAGQTGGSGGIGSLVGYGRSQPASGTHPGAGAANATMFTISGALSDLYPGERVKLVLTVTNPFTYAITVTSIITTVANASPKCAAKFLTVASFQGSRAVSAGRSIHISVVAVMRHSAPNACQGVTFPLQYDGAGSST